MSVVTSPDHATDLAGAAADPDVHRPVTFAAVRG